MKPIKFNNPKHQQASINALVLSTKIAAEKGLDWDAYVTILLEMTQDQSSLVRRLLKSGYEVGAETKGKSVRKYDSRYAAKEEYEDMVRYLDESTPMGTTTGTNFTLEKLADNVNSMGYRKFNRSRFTSTDIGSIIGRSGRKL